MRHLKHFESKTELTKEFIHDMFYDIIDENFLVNVELSSCSFKPGFFIGTVPYFKIEIKSNDGSHIDRVGRRIKKLSENPVLIEVLEVMSERISDYGWHMVDYVIYDSLKIFLFKVKDKEVIRTLLKK